MAKAMSIFGMVVGAVVALVFLLDLAIGVPFGGVSMAMDVGCLIGGLMVAYMGFDAFRASG